MSKTYPGLLHCYRCDAHYRVGGWMIGRYEPGTGGDFKVSRHLDDNDCPICRKPPLLEKPAIVTTMAL